MKTPIFEQNGFEKNRKACLLALSLLTRIPAGSFDEITDQDSGRSALFYPVIGVLIGVILYLPILLFPNTPPHFLAVLVITLWAIITGGLHLDGLADSADGWLGGLGDKERTLRIMKDPVIGAAGAIALVCFLLLKASALSVLIDNKLGWLVIITPVLGRLMILFTFYTTSYANKTGMANTVVENLPENISLVIVAIGLLTAGFFSFWGLVTVLIGFFLLRRLMIKRLDGCTGDTVGATVEISEMLFMSGVVLSL